MQVWDLADDFEGDRSGCSVATARPRRWPRLLLLGALALLLLLTSRVELQLPARPYCEHRVAMLAALQSEEAGRATHCELIDEIVEQRQPG